MIAPANDHQSSRLRDVARWLESACCSLGTSGAAGARV